MSIYTKLSKTVLQPLLAHYALGSLQEFGPIQSGISNSNYWVTTDQDKYVLTIFESLTNSDLSFYLDFTRYLAEHGFPCPKPVLTTDKQPFIHYGSKPVALVPFFDGTPPQAASKAQLTSLGLNLGDLHQLGGKYTAKIAPSYALGFPWMEQTARDVYDKLAESEQQLLQDELQFQQEQDYHRLPTGIIHADLFRDNTLFVHETLSCIFDFYYACEDNLLLDFSIVVNDWCFGPNQQFEQSNFNTLLNHYQSKRAFSPEEIISLPAMLRGAALRFWLLRLQHNHFASGPLLAEKDAREMQAKLLFWRASPLSR